MSPDEHGKPPQDIVAIFHASFHPTKGNVIDWSLKASDDLSLENLEFSALPSGLHLVEQDVVYFTKDAHRGVCVFRQRTTAEHGHRGFRLSSLGVLLAPSKRPRPWRHVPALKQLIYQMYSILEERGSQEPEDGDWDAARRFYEERSVLREDLGGAGDWDGWSHELDGDCQPDAEPPATNPTLHLPHLLRILGPSALTLYKHILGRRRVLIYTLPPVEAACVLCQVAADICFEQQAGHHTPSVGGADVHLKGRHAEGVNVLGMVTLMDLGRMDREGAMGRGWVACTTDAIFLEKPEHYDLLVDLTTSTPLKATRPTLSISKPVLPKPPRGPTHRLSSIRFTWSDVKLWNELDRILGRDASGHAPDHSCCAPSPSSLPSGDKPSVAAAWTDVWRVYEDVCVICAGLWMGSWRGNSRASYSTGNGSISNWGAVRLEGDDDLSLGSGRVRNLGDGIEGRPVDYGPGAGIASGPAPGTKRSRMASGSSWSNSKAGASTQVVAAPSSPSAAELEDRRERQVLTTLALLQTFHASTRFTLSRLSTFVRGAPENAPVVLAPRDVLSFELGPLSALDARYLEWLGAEYGGGRAVSVRRGWRDLFGLFLGF